MIRLGFTTGTTTGDAFCGTSDTENVTCVLNRMHAKYFICCEDDDVPEVRLKKDDVMYG